MNLVEHMSYHHLKNRDLKGMGIYGPIKQSLLIHLDSWVLNDIIKNIED